MSTSNLIDLTAAVDLQYDGGYHPEHIVVKWFWEILDEMPMVKKKQFLSFTTGYAGLKRCGIFHILMLAMFASESYHTVR